VLSVIIPVFNERQTIAKVLVAASAALPSVDKEIIVVDDGSTDGTREWLAANFPGGRRSATSLAVDPDGNLSFAQRGDTAQVAVSPIYHKRNSGKGASVRTGFNAATGEVFVIQDADLVYDPAEWSQMYELIVGRAVADVVYGSRFYGRPHRSLYFHHYLANRLISLFFNLLFNQTLTDIETGQKMMSAAVAKSLRLTANDFGIEVEISAEIARRRTLRIYEVGVAYYGRTYTEGKKIGWRDGVKALWYVVRFRFR
jgi:glycosyltransferase involved in cell wall biosynthesis